MSNSLHLRLHKRIPWELISLFILIILYLSKTTPIIYEDSFTYIHFDAIRPPVYPIFLWLFHQFGQYQFVLVMWVQTIITFTAMIYASVWLQKHLHVPRWLNLTILSCTLLFLYYYKMPRLIGSEGLAFPFFIITFFMFVECFNSFNMKKIILLCLFTNILILTRLQFYYLYGIFFLLIAWYGWKKIPYKKVLIATTIMLLSILFCTLVNRSYHYYMHGHFSDAPTTGTLLMVQALYLSNMSDAQYFTDPNEKALFIKIMSELEKNRLTEQSEHAVLDLSQQSSVAYYHAAYNPIINIVNQIAGGTYSYQKDPILLNISKILYQHNIKENVKFYFLKLGVFFGSIPFFISYLMIVLVTLVGILINENKSPEPWKIFSGVALLTILFNTAFVMILQPNQANYFFYSYFLIFCLSAVFAKKYLAH